MNKERFFYGVDCNVLPQVFVIVSSFSISEFKAFCMIIVMLHYMLLHLTVVTGIYVCEYPRNVHGRYFI